MCVRVSAAPSDQSVTSSNETWSLTPLGHWRESVWRYRQRFYHTTPVGHWRWHHRLCDFRRWTEWKSHTSFPLRLDRCLGRIFRDSPVLSPAVVKIQPERNVRLYQGKSSSQSLVYFWGLCTNVRVFAIIRAVSNLEGAYVSKLT